MGWVFEESKGGNITAFHDGQKQWEERKQFLTNALTSEFGYAFHLKWEKLMSVIDKIMDIDITPAPQWTGYRMEIVPRGYVKITGFFSLEISPE